MIGAIVYVTLPGFALGAIVMAAANRSVAPEVARARWLKLLVFGLIVHAVLGAAMLGRSWLLALVALILAIGTREIAGAWTSIPRPRPLRVWPLYGAAALLGLWATARLSPEAFAFLFVVTAAFDGFSQVVGQWLGRRRLAPRLSPGKTVGGLVGGLVAASVIAALLRDLLAVDAPTAAALGISTGVAALIGDLSASWVKRRAGIKDYSALLPGQGGVLDRFDSLLGVLAAAGTVLLLRG